LCTEQYTLKAPSRPASKQSAVGVRSFSVLPSQRMAFPSLVGTLCPPCLFVQGALHLVSIYLVWFTILHAFLTLLLSPLHCHLCIISSLQRNVNRPGDWNCGSQSCRRLYPLQQSEGARTITTISHRAYGRRRR
jgi:hypothetical protein